MTTTGQNRRRPTGNENLYEQTSPRGNAKGMRKRFGTDSSPTSMAKPAPILKKQRQNNTQDDRFNESVVGWRQPDDLTFVTNKQVYSPIGTPPRLRTLVTSPGIEPYRNTLNLRRLNTPLPTLDDWSNPSVGLDTWGVDPLDYRLSDNLHLLRRYPSPLTHFGLSQRQKKPYIVVPRLSTLGTPPISTDARLAHRPIPVYAPDPQYAYLERVRPQPSTRLPRDPPSDYFYIRRNEAFANRFIEDFIGKCIEDQLIPDILLEIISELDRENKKQGEKSIKPEVDRYVNELNTLISSRQDDHNHLFSDEWIRELDYQRPPIPTTTIDTHISTLKPLDFREIPPSHRMQSTYHQLPTDRQDRILNHINEELIENEIHDLVTEITGKTVMSKLNNVSNMNEATTSIYHDIEDEVVREIVRDTAFDVHRTARIEVDQVQFNSIERHAQNKLLDTIFMDQLMKKYIKQNGSVVDVDDLSRFLDATILDNIIFHYQDIQDQRSRTIDNYALRKFHLNTFMNMTMDLLLTELSASLIEDMKDLELQERRVF